MWLWEVTRLLIREPQPTVLCSTASYNIGFELMSMAKNVYVYAYLGDRIIKPKSKSQS